MSYANRLIVLYIPVLTLPMMPQVPDEHRVIVVQLRRDAAGDRVLLHVRDGRDGEYAWRRRLHPQGVGRRDKAQVNSHTLRMASTPQGVRRRDKAQVNSRWGHYYRSTWWKSVRETDAGTFFRFAYVSRHTVILSTLMPFVYDKPPRVSSLSQEICHFVVDKLSRVTTL